MLVADIQLSSHRVYNGVYNIHTDNRSYKRRLKAWATQHTSRKPKQDPGPLDTVNFQDPQVLFIPRIQECISSCSATTVG